MPSSKLQQIIDSHQGSEPLDVPKLMKDLQEAYGFLPERHLKTLQKELGLKMSAVYQVVMKQPEFTFDPPGENHVKVCVGPNCSPKGSPEICQRLEDHLQLGAEETTSDGQLTLASVYCCSVCAEGPIVAVNDTIYKHQTPDSAAELVDAKLPNSVSRPRD